MHNPDASGEQDQEANANFVASDQAATGNQPASYDHDLHEQIELGLSSGTEAEVERVQPLAEMTVYVAYPQWFLPAEPVERSVDFRKSARHGRLRFRNSRVR